MQLPKGCRNFPELIAALKEFDVDFHALMKHLKGPEEAAVLEGLLTTNAQE